MTSINIPNINIFANKNETLCGCDGSISIYVNGDNPPFTYSIDGGITYKNSPLFTNLCSGLYSIIVKDSLGLTKNSLLTLKEPSPQVTYTVSLNTSSVVTTNNGIIFTKTYTTNFSVNPPLPNGVYITLDLYHTNTFNTGPNDNSAILNTNSGLFLNSILQPISSTGVTTGTTINIYPGCQSNIVYATSTNDVWSSIVLTSSNDYSLVTTTSVTKNENIACYVGDSNDKFFVSNLRINGCGCCNIIGN
jgi:hypothetical protein